MVYDDFKSLTRRTTSVKVLCENVFEITNNPKFDE